MIAHLYFFIAVIGFSSVQAAEDKVTVIDDKLYFNGIKIPTQFKINDRDVGTEKEILGHVLNFV